MWYNVSTWRMRAQAKDEAGGTAAAPLTGPGRKAKGGSRECGIMCPPCGHKRRRGVSLTKQTPQPSCMRAVMEGVNTAGVVRCVRLLKAGRGPDMARTEHMPHTGCGRAGQRA